MRPVPSKTSANAMPPCPRSDITRPPKWIFLPLFSSSSKAASASALLVSRWESTGYASMPASFSSSSFFCRSARMSCSLIVLYDTKFPSLWRGLLLRLDLLRYSRCCRPRKEDSYAEQWEYQQHDQEYYENIGTLV